MITTDRNVNWDWLRSFIVVSEQGSLSAATVKTGLSQPTLSRHIDSLENQLGVSLFERTGRGLNPTQAALKIAPFIHQMQAQADSLLLSLQQTSSPYEGTVRISCTPSIAAYCLPTLLIEMRRAKPEIQIEIIATSEQSNLLKREADIALRMARPTQNGLITKKLGELAFGVFAHQRYLSKHGPPQVPSDLLAHSLIGFYQFDNIIQGFAKEGFTVQASQFALRTDDAVTYWQAVRNGVGIGFLAAHIAAQDSKVVRLLPAMKLPGLPVWLTSHRELRGNANIRWVYNFLAQRFMSTVL